MFTTTGSFRLLQIEMCLTKTLLAMSIMTPFFYSIGMDQAQIGLSQALFTVALLLLNIPTGWIADKFSRRWCNFAGDMTVVVSLLFYSQAQGFGDVVIAEILFGIGAALSQGADSGLQKAFCALLSRGDSAKEAILLRKSNGRVGSIQLALQAILVFVGGLIGSVDMRLAIALSAVPYMIGALCILCMREVGERHVSQHKNPFRDMASVLGTAAKTYELRWSIIAFAIGREVSHVMVWLATPILLLAGVSPALVGLGWALNSVVAVGGSLLARSVGGKLAEWQQFAVAAGAVVIALSILSVHLSLATIWLYAVMGFSQGWSGVTLRSMLQRHTPASKMSMIDSTAGTCAQLLYVPLVIIISAIGTMNITLSLVAIVVTFTPLVIITSVKLRQME